MNIYARSAANSLLVVTTGTCKVFSEAIYIFKEEFMLLVRAIIRPEKVGIVLSELLAAGFPAVTKMDVFGRGKQKGIAIGDVHYDEIPKEMLLMVVNDEDKDDVVKVIMRNARTGDKGHYGDGRIFISPVVDAYTISTGKQGL
jgi:nitrogen regulatory protein PII 1